MCDILEPINIYLCYLEIIEPSVVPIIPALGGEGQEDEEFMVVLTYMATLMPA